MSLKSKFKTSSSSANDGIFLRFTAEKNSDGTIPEFKVARLYTQNKNYVSKLRKLNDELILKYGVVSITDLSFEDAHKMNLELFIDTILLGWDNFEAEEDGVKTPYSKEKAREIFSNPDWYDLYQEIEKQASNASNFKKERLEQASKN